MAFDEALARGKRSNALIGKLSGDEALRRLLDGTGLVAQRTDAGVFIIRQAGAKNAADASPPHAVGAAVIATSAAVAAADAEPGEAPPGGAAARIPVPVVVPAGDSSQIVVTGSRIVRNGNEATTPVTVESSQELMATTPSSLPDGLNKLPSFDSTSTPNNASTGANGRGYNTPGDFLNLRGLGAIRTLILQDGRRVPGTFYDTTVDTNMLPQMLISRVDVVTGGASAVYGSDAVAGVVNFITDTKFLGWKGVLDGGVSTYGDAGSQRVGIANGFKVGERGHFEWSAEYYNRDAITEKDARPYGALGSSVVGSGTKASPYSLIFGARESNASYNGLISSGPLAGMQFSGDGQSLIPFNPGAPTATTNTAIGGDGGTAGSGYLIPSLQTGQVFGRFDYDFTDSIHGSVEGRYSHSHSYTANQIYTNQPSAYPLYVYSGNAYLTSAEQGALFPPGGANAVLLNRFDQDLFTQLGLDSNVAADAFTADLNGKVFGYRDFKWDAYYTHGDTSTNLTTLNNVNSARFYAAADAVRDPATGNIVCNVALTAPGAFPGCQPLNLFGSGNESQAALNYIFQDTGWTARNTLDDWGANITGTAFDEWAGPVQFALGGEFRHATLNVDTTVPDDTFNPQGLRLGAAGSALPASPAFPGGYPASNLAYFKEVQSGAQGSEDVIEGNIEFDAPLVRDLPLLKLLSLNGAYRHTYYNASGDGDEESRFSADTWKIGVEWRVVDDLHFRASRSRDIRAPTLWDLYQQQVVSSSGIVDPLTGQGVQANTVTGGNPKLVPERADNTIVGVVYEPSRLRGFSISVDWYQISIDNAIGNVNGLNPTIQNACLASDGSSPYCALVVRPISYNSTSSANYPSLIYDLSENIAKTYAQGFDVEIDYRVNLSDFNLPGQVNARALGTIQPTNKTQSLPGAVTTNAAGTSVQPADKFTFTAGYRLDGFEIDATARYQSAFAQTGTPGQVYDIPSVPAYTTMDLGVSYDIKVDDATVTSFLDIDNITNAQGGLYQTPSYTSSPGMNYPVGPGADLIGRYYTAGVRFRF